jgi:hypothetical protein
VRIPGRHVLTADAKKSEIGAPVGSRTPNLLIRSQMLYPIELRVRLRAREQAKIHR